MNYFAFFDFSRVLDVSYLVIYTLMWCFLFCRYLKIRKTFDAATFLLFMYSLYGISSLLLYFDSYYGEDFYDLSLLPFVYLFFMLYLTSKPVLNYDTNKIDGIAPPNMFLLNSVAIVYILASILGLPSIIQGLTKGLTLMMIEDSQVQEMYAESADKADSAGHGINNLRSIIALALTEVGVMFSFYYLSLKHHSNHTKYIMFGLMISMFVSTFATISLGQRGLMIETFLLIIATYFLFRDNLPVYVKRIIKYMGMVFLTFVFSVFALMTFSRFGNNDDRGVMSTVYYYAGQENLIFNKYAFDNNGIRYGDRTIPLFKKVIGFSDVPNNYIERREKYSDLEVNDEVFITHVGDVLLDFGPIIGTILILIIMYNLIRLTKVRNREIKFHQLIIIHATLYLCVIGGLKLYPFSDVGGNLKLIVYVILYMVFRIEYDMRTLRKQKQKECKQIQENI